MPEVPHTQHPGQGQKGIRQDLPLCSHRAEEPMESMGNRLGEGTGGYGTEMTD